MWCNSLTRYPGCLNVLALGGGAFFKFLFLLGWLGGSFAKLGFSVGLCGFANVPPNALAKYLL